MRKKRHIRQRSNLKHLFDPDEQGSAEELPATPGDSSQLVIKQLREDLGELIDMEKAVARLELSHKAAELRRDAAGYGVAALLCALGACCVAAAILLLMATFMSAWLAALLLGSALIAAGVLIALNLRSRARRFRELPHQANNNASP